MRYYRFRVKGQTHIIDAEALVYMAATRATFARHIGEQILTLAEQEGKSLNGVVDIRISGMVDE